MSRELLGNFNALYFSTVDDLVKSFKDITELKQEQAWVTQVITEQGPKTDALFLRLTIGLDSVAEDIHSKNAKTVCASNAALLQALCVSRVYPRLREDERDGFWQMLRELLQQMSTIGVILTTCGPVVDNLVADLKAKFKPGAPPPTTGEFMKTLFTNPDLQEKAMNAMGVRGCTKEEGVVKMDNFFGSLATMFRGLGLTTEDTTEDMAEEEDKESEESENKEEQEKGEKQGDKEEKKGAEKGKAEKEEEEKPLEEVTASEVLKRKKRRNRKNKKSKNVFAEVVRMTEEMRPDIKPENMDKFGASLEGFVGNKSDSPEQAQMFSAMQSVMEAFQSGDPASAMAFLSRNICQNVGQTCGQEEAGQETGQGVGQSGGDLSGGDLSGGDLSGGDLSGGDLSGENFMKGIMEAQKRLMSSSFGICGHEAFPRTTCSSSLTAESKLSKIEELPMGAPSEAAMEVPIEVRNEAATFTLSSTSVVATAPGPATMPEPSEGAERRDLSS